MKWSKQIVQEDGSTLDIEAVSASPFSDSRRMEFHVNKGETSFSTALQLTNMTAMKIETKIEHISPEEWLFEKGCNLIVESLKQNNYPDREFLINEFDVPVIETLALSDLSILQ